MQVGDNGLSKSLTGGKQTFFLPSGRSRTQAKITLLVCTYRLATAETVLAGVSSR